MRQHMAALSGSLLGWQPAPPLPNLAVQSLLAPTTRRPHSQALPMRVAWARLLMERHALLTIRVSRTMFAGDLQQVLQHVTDELATEVNREQQHLMLMQSQVRFLDTRHPLPVVLIVFA